MPQFSWEKPMEKQIIEFCDHMAVSVQKQSMKWLQEEHGHMLSNRDYIKWKKENKNYIQRLIEEIEREVIGLPNRKDIKLREWKRRDEKETGVKKEWGESFFNAGWKTLQEKQRKKLAEYDV